MATSKQHANKSTLIIVSNRLPLSLRKVDNSFESSTSSGGLVTALSGLTDSMNFKWLGWPGITAANDEEQENAQRALGEKMAKGIFLEEQLAQDHYDGFSNTILWPTLHYQSGIEFREEFWEAYRQVNEIFADVVAEEAHTGDLIWIHDYHLMLLPSLLRSRLRAQGKECPIGFTLHTPFPARDVWRGLPVEKELVTGMLASDVVGFHTEEYKENFATACVNHSDVVGLEETDCIRMGDHLAHLGVFIVGIDPIKFSETLKNPYVVNRINELRHMHSNKTIMIGVDRLDYTKGLVQKLKGYERFLNDNPELRNKVVLVQVAVPSRENVKEYQDLEEEIQTLVGKICGEHCAPDNFPLVYMHRSISFTELTALYSVAEVCLVTSQRDGMNLVASEYIACQGHRHGVLVLSEFAGAASFMQEGSILFHPSSTDQLSQAIYQAVTMNQDERKKRYESLCDFVTNYTRCA
ncbi:hypothetical protein UA08_06393 [Talaromyces atroroseus]|uniref:Uncharacterized protein n=1 Tax=Talaromyces atroroseus TaxID=1441469 RepID=A0A225ACV6_TALAT|nr:hypothetical protein UA08_06393 [Talaromyces atroroseus]OKL58230.1 hypothetical protein UA08_06393 [Talaromyces atroroseus]